MGEKEEHSTYSIRRPTLAEILNTDYWLPYADSFVDSPIKELKKRPFPENKTINSLIPCTLQN